MGRRWIAKAVRSRRSIYRASATGRSPRHWRSVTRRATNSAPAATQCGSTTPIGAAGAGQVAFTISGLETDDSGTLTFSDQAGHAVVVTIVNGQAIDSQGHPISTVNLSSLGDGT